MLKNHVIIIQVAQRQQQQQQRLQQQLTGGTQSLTPVKIISNAKPKTIVTVKKVQRVNGAKVIVTNNCEKVCEGIHYTVVNNHLPLIRL